MTVIFISPDKFAHYLSRKIIDEIQSSPKFWERLMSNRGIGLLLSPLPRTHRAIFTAIRSGSSLPAFMGAIEKHTNRLLC